MSASHYVHDLNPYLINGQSFALAWYWFFYFVGILWVLFYSENFLKTYPHYMKRHQFYTLLLWCWPVLFLSARMGYVVIYNLKYYQDHPQKIFSFWQGGMSFHGALLGLSIIFYVYSRHQRLSFFKITDLFSLSAPLALCLGRIGNFINGELAGTVTEMPWGVVFPRYDELPRHPSQLYQALAEGLLLFILLHFNREKLLKTTGSLSSFFLMGYGLLRFLVEFFRLPDPQIGTIASLNLGQYLSLSMLLIGAIVRYRITK